jgi:8-oxo-dGTP diphosphatase
MELTEDENGLRYPHLFQEAIWPWGPARVRFELFERLPDPELVANTNMVGWVGKRCLVLRLEDGSPEIPGGTLEPGEDYLQALRRELREEAGARLATHQVLGGWLCRSLAPAPYRPHLPHPDYIRLVIWGDVEICGKPERPPGGEPVERVELVSPDRAAEIFQDAGRPELAELYLLSAELRKSR